MKKIETWFFLRGLVRESGHWGIFLDQFSEKFPDKKVITLDLPGNGLLFQKKSPASITGMVREIRATQDMSAGNNHLFAISLGAMVGFEWMHLYPEDFSSAVFVNTSMRGLNPFYKRLLPKNYCTLLSLFFSGIARRERKILEMTSNRPELYERTAAEWVRIQEKHPVSKVNAIRQLCAALTFTPPKKTPKGKILILQSLLDRLVSPECSETIAKHWSVEKRSNNGAGHDLTLDDPQWVLKELEKFIL